MPLLTLKVKAMTERNLLTNEKLESEIYQEQMMSYKMERIKEMLDDFHYEGFSDNLTNQEWMFYLEQYKDLF